MRKVEKLFIAIGRIIIAIRRTIINFFVEFGAVCSLISEIIRFTPRIWRDRRLILDQMEHIGADSLPLVLIIGLFTGMVSAWQAADQLQGIASLSLLGRVVSGAIFMELGPVLTAIVIAGRVGASIGAELGTMKVTEQIDALETLAISPVRYLAMPRFIAALTMMPILVIFANIIAIFGSFFVANFMLHLSSQTFFSSVQQHFVVNDVMFGLVKSIVFGGTTALLGCHIGFRTEGGAEGVGQATVRSFVLSSAMILILDFTLWMLIH